MVVRIRVSRRREMLIEAGFGYRFEFMDQLEVAKRFRHARPSPGATLSPRRSESGEALRDAVA
jgi:hypothetical protein